MSSDQFSDKPLPPAEKRCPHCGQVTTSNAGMCWLCLERFSVQEGVTKPLLPPGDGKSHQDSAAWAVLGVIAIFLTIAIAIETPGVLIVLLVFAIPALIRTEAGEPRGPSDNATVMGSYFTVFLSSLGISVIIGIATVAAFFAICFAVGMGVFAATDSLGAIVCGITAGVPAGACVAVFLFRRIWA